MDTTELVKHVNDLTDESFPAEQVISFLNDAVAALNTEVKAVIPNITLLAPSILPEKWQRTLLVPYAAARIKQNDGSQFEYNDLYMQFERNLHLFKTGYTVPDEYKDDDQGNNSFPPNYTGNPYVWG